jgi:NADPH-dependent 2,4-dienoyl-CoA reductase/sulfur reductase-like enzyme
MSSQDRALVPAQQHNGQPYMERADIVIIGNGIAGLTAAVEARRLAPDQRIVIVTDQIHPTINTPALKQFAIGKLEREQLLAYPAGTERRERIHVVNSRVEAIHANSKYVTLRGNRGFGYGSLLIATGGSPMGLDEKIPGRNFDGVLTLHRLQDYLDLRRRLPEVSEAIVIGGGVHAIETVMGLLYWGIRVHWLIRGKTFMRGMLDGPASEMVLESMRRIGAIVHTETEVMGIMGRVGSVAGVVTNNQEMIPCQLLLTCTGTQAVTSLAKQCSAPLKHKKGIEVDDQLRTSVPDIYAAGDVAALKNPLTGQYEPRAVWFAAISQARIAGAMLTGHDELARQPFGIQWHATHLGELSMLTVGEPMKEGNEVITLTDNSQGNYRRLAIVDDRLVGYLALGTGAQPDSLAIKRIIDEQHSVRPITKALLRGDFDARQYISQLRSRAAQTILTTGKLPDGVVAALPEPKPVATPRVVEAPRRETEAIPVTPAASAISPLSLPGQSDDWAPPRRRQTEPLSQPGQPAAQLDEPRTPAWEEEVSAFSGNLPRLSRENIAREYSSRENSSRENSSREYNREYSSGEHSGSRSRVAPPQRIIEEEEVSPFSGNLPMLTSSTDSSDDFLTDGADEVSPFTGNLPNIRSKFPAREVESTLVPVSSSDRRAQDRQVFKDPSRSANRQRREEQEQQQAASRYTNGLWSYANKDNLKKVEKRR